MTRYPIEQVLENETNHFKDVKGEVRTTQNIYLIQNNLVISRDEESVIGVIDDKSIIIYWYLKIKKGDDVHIYLSLISEMFKKRDC